MPTPNPPTTRRTPDAPKIIGLLPAEHRLPALVFLIAEPVLLACVYFGDSNVRLAGICGIVIITGIFLLLFFRRPAVQEVPVNQHSEKQSEPIPVVKSADDQLLLLYSQTQRDNCPLFKKAAVDKYKEAVSYFRNLCNDRMDILCDEEMSVKLEYLMCEINIIRIMLATSHKEMEEFREDNWWMNRYLQIQDQAIKQKKKIKRIFILESEEMRKSGETVFTQNKELGVDIKIAFEQRISKQDIVEAGNCLIFCNSSGEPIYCLQALHTDDGAFAKATIFRGQEQMQKILEAYKRIESNATQP